MYFHCLHLLIFTQGAMSSMALPRCSSTCSANRICTSMICHRLKQVRSFKVKTTTSYWIWCDVHPSFEASLSVCCAPGFSGGSPVPPEIVRRVKKDMNVKKMIVSIRIPYQIKQTFTSPSLKNMHLSCFVSCSTEPLRPAPSHLCVFHKTAMSCRKIHPAASCTTLRYAPSLFLSTFINTSPWWLTMGL